MATPKTKVPAVPAASAQPQAGLSADSIAASGESLTRLIVAAITLPLTAANAIGTSLSRLLSSVTATLDGTASAQGSNDIVKATSDLVNTSAGLYLGMIKAIVSGLEQVTKSINTVGTDSGTPPTPPRK